MAKFSVGREDDSEGPSSPRRKRQRVSVFTRRSQQLQQPSNVHRPIVEDDDDEEGEEEEQEMESYNDDDGESESPAEVDDGDDRDGSEKTTAGQPSNGVPRENNRGSDDGPSEDGSISVTLTDPDVLDCPICLEPLNVPVFQCENGHVACTSCCTKLGNKCPSCSWPIGYNRCRALEKVIVSIKVSCQNMKYGCKDSVSYSKKQEHEEMCIYAPCSCPFPDCGFLESSHRLFLHFETSHPNSVKYFWYNCLFSVNLEKQQNYLILQEQDEGLIFILNKGIEQLGYVFRVSCIEPRSSKVGHSYDLIARNGINSVRLQACTENIPGRIERPFQKSFLVVPYDFVGSCGQLQLDLCIRRHHKSPEQI